MKYYNYGLTRTKLGPLLCFCSFFSFGRAPKIDDQKYHCINNMYLKIARLIYQIEANFFENIVTKTALYGVLLRSIEINLSIDLAVGKN